MTRNRRTAYISPMPRNWNIRLRVGEWYRLHKTDRCLSVGQIPAWWDFTVDCGYSDMWYRCRRCDICLNHRNRPNWDKLYNWGK
jgi:hypothetical protein